MAKNFEPQKILVISYLKFPTHKDALYKVWLTNLVNIWQCPVVLEVKIVKCYAQTE